MGTLFCIRIVRLTEYAARLIAFKYMIKVDLQKKEQISARFITKITGKLISLVRSCPGTLTVILRVAQGFEFRLNHLEDLPCKFFNIQQRFPMSNVHRWKVFSGSWILLHSQNRVSHLMTLLKSK